MIKSIALSDLGILQHCTTQYLLKSKGSVLGHSGLTPVAEQIKFDGNLYFSEGAIK